MNRSSKPPEAHPSNRWRVAAAIATITVATLIAYHNSLAGPLIFDDSSAITNNPSIRTLWPLWPVLMPPAECTVAGRPLANLTFAINYAFSGTEVKSYHVFNVVMHLFAALTLFGIVRRTLAVVPERKGFGMPISLRLARDSLPISLAGAGLWTVHPLLTESVTYISQRTEVLMGLFHLLTLYAFIRAIGSGGLWWLASIMACFAGVASKEGMVTAPLIVLLYDRTFVSGSFRQAWQTHRVYYLGLILSWVFLAFLLAGLSHRSVGFGLGVSWWKYALTESEAVLLYLRLIFWPHPLIFDYGAIFPEDLSKVTALAGVVGVLLIASAAAIRWRPRIGFPLAAFFILLSPTSSVVPVATQPIAENRVYLPSAAVLVLGVTGLHVVAGSSSFWLCLLAGSSLILQTVQRNKVYRSEISLWTDNIAKRPMAPRGFENLGEALYAAGKLEAARRQFEEAIRIDPGYAGAHHNLGSTLHDLGDLAGALRHFEEAVRLQPAYPIAHNNFGNALLKAGEVEKALLHLREALRLYDVDWRLKPDLPETHNNLGNALLFQGDLLGARHHYSEAVRLRPDFAEAQMNLGVARRELGEYVEASVHLKDALHLKPDFAEAHFNLALTYLQLEKLLEAEAHLKRAITLKPAFVQAHRVLAELSSARGELREAQAHYEAALSLRPDDLELQAKVEQIRNARANGRKQQP